MTKDRYFWLGTVLYVLMAGIIAAQSLDLPKAVTQCLAVVGAMCTALKAKLSSGAQEPEEPKE